MEQVNAFYKFAAKARIALLDDNQLLEGWKALDDAEVRYAFEAQRAERRAKNKAALIAMLQA